MIDMANRADIAVRLVAVKLLFAHGRLSSVNKRVCVYLKARVRFRRTWP
jgi:hypothetical protein